MQVTIFCSALIGMIQSFSFYAPTEYLDQLRQDNPQARKSLCRQVFNSNFDLVWLEVSSK